MNTNKRKEIEKLVYDFLTIVDVNSNFVNRDFYEGLFASMDEKEFNEWVKDIGNTPEDTISVYQMPWKSVSLAQLEKASEFLNVPIEEYVYYRHLVDGVDIRTKYPVIVGYLNIKRLQQILDKKNQFTFDTKSTDYATGEVTKKSKVHHISNSEVYSLLIQNNEAALKEFFGPRSSNLEQKKEFNNDISLDGWVSLKDLTKSKDNNEAINTLDMYIIASGLRSDLLFDNNNDYKTPFRKEELRRTLSRKN